MKTIAVIIAQGRQTFSRRAAILILILLLVDINAFAQEKPKGKTPPPKDFTTRVWLGAHLLPGSGQVVNGQYWKLPVFYGGMGSMLYLGINANKDYHHRRDVFNMLSDYSPDRELIKRRMVEKRQTRNYYYAAAGAFYAASVIDAVLVYSKGKHSPAAATIISTIVPGLGQAYNKKYWKVPIVYGGLATFYYIADWNNVRYRRYKTALKHVLNGEDDEFNGIRSESDLRYYMDNYHRNRDLAILGFAAVYVLNIVDANVDAHLYSWNVDDDLSFRVEPSVVNPALASTFTNAPIFGISCKFTF